MATPSFERLLQHVPAAFAVTSGYQHTLLFANAAFRTLVTTAGDQFQIGKPITSLFAAPEAAAFSAVLDRSFQANLVARNRRIDPMREGAGPMICNVWPEVAGNGDPQRLIVELRFASQGELSLEIRGEVVERLLLSALREQDTADVADAAQHRATFLAVESRRLAESLDEGETLAAMERMALPHVGDWCIVDILGDDGVMHRQPVPHPAVVTESAPGENSPLLTVPLVIRGRIIGAVTFVSGRRETPFSQEDIQLAEDLASRSAMALDRARAYGEAKALRIKAEMASHAKSTFLSMMSHELRTPLNAIGGYVDLIDMELHGPVTAEQRADLARIRSNQRYLMGLISDLLNLTRVDSGNVEYSVGDIMMSEMLAASVALVEPLIAQRQLVFDGLTCDATIIARGDREKVIQILVNLLSNAIKFTPADGRIGITCTQHGHAILVCVNDTGIGIPADKLEAIFEPFVQVKGRGLGPEAGVGLGLSISRSLARDMRGDLSVESTLGGGSCFTLSLPLSSPALRSAE